MKQTNHQYEEMIRYGDPLMGGRRRKRRGYPAMNFDHRSPEVASMNAHLRATAYDGQEQETTGGPVEDHRSVSFAMKSNKPRRILAPIDFSPESEKTLRFAKRLATKFGAKVHLAHIVAPLSHSLGRGMLPLALSEAQIAVGSLKRLKRLAAKACVPPGPNRCIVRVGATADTINEIAREIGADLIVISTRGYTGLKYAFLGSTTTRVVRSAPCPVLVVRDDEVPSGGEGARREASLQFQKILVPLDFSESSRLGLDYALGFAREFRASLKMFHSVAVHNYALGDKYTALEAPKLAGLQQDFFEKEVKALGEGLSKLRIKIEAKVVVGSPVQQIARCVSDHDVDLIITSTHGSSGVRRLFIGSTAEQIVRHATCPVLVVPNRPSSAKSNSMRRFRSAPASPSPGATRMKPAMLAPLT